MMSSKRTLRLLVNAAHGLMFVLILLAQIIPDVEGCNGLTCSQCIASGAECAWCADANFTDVAAERCGLNSALLDKGCINIQSPKTEEIYAFRKDAPVTDGDDDQGTDAIQLQPQAMKVKVRPRGKGYDFHVTFRPANNFPVDLYFLFDLSGTMNAYINDLATLANDIASEIGKISKNFQMGYGTFQDKVLLPFTNTHPAKLQNPCTSGDPCAPSFAYHHEVPLTKNIPQFTDAVDRSETTGNLDRPEGGFDAMMQAIVCKTVGWRDNSRQLIIFASDAQMHFAGDGKLAGLITPNDGQCHLDDGRTNSMASKQDYPSVGQISEALDRTKKYVIFAVIDNVFSVYEQLQLRVPRSTAKVLRSGADSNIMDIVRDKYREMTKGVKLEYKTSSDNIRVSIKPNCKHQEGSSCTNLNIGEKVAPFEVNIRAERCPENPKDRIQTVTIAPSDFLKDSLNVTVEIICDCECENQPGANLEPSDQCSEGNGTVECGICRCFLGRSGSHCQCDQQDQDLGVTEGTCMPEGGSNTTAPVCSGAGECVCGMCQCHSSFSGRYCQCNDEACPVSDGLVCGGNGECRCETCYCMQNFTGDACECPTATDSCLPDVSDDETAVEVCSGHGTCQCGQCVCDEGYLGSFCELCFQCGKSVCEIDKYSKCANCAVTSGESCSDLDCPEVVMVPEVDISGEQTGACRSWQTEECHIRYSIDNPGPNVTLHVQRAEVCTEGPDIIIIVLGVIGGVVGVGLILLLLFKLLTSLFDKLEYQHFVKELQTPKWAKHNNPIYKEATTTYRNPMSRD